MLFYTVIICAVGLPFLLLGRGGAPATIGAGILLVEIALSFLAGRWILRTLRRRTRIPEYFQGLPILAAIVVVYASVNLCSMVALALLAPIIPNE